MSPALTLAMATSAIGLEIIKHIPIYIIPLALMIISIPAILKHKEEL